MAALFGKTGQNLIKIFGDDVAQQAAKATLAGVVTGQQRGGRHCR
jgi:hypothetical protein